MPWIKVVYSLTEIKNGPENRLSVSWATCYYTLSGGRGKISEIAGKLQTTFVGHEKLVETCVDGIRVSLIMNGWRPFYPVWDHKTERSEFSIQKLAKRVL